MEYTVVMAERQHRRRSSVNFGGETYLPENTRILHDICPINNFSRNLGDTPLTSSPPVSYAFERQLCWEWAYAKKLFQNGDRSPSWILSEVIVVVESTSGKLLSVRMHQIRFRYLKPRPIYVRFKDLQVDGRRHLGFYKKLFSAWILPALQCLFAC